MQKTGFTLAEVLITLMILGIIAALTVPTLIQTTQKKEEVTQIKKGLSMINQAISSNYSLTQDDLNKYNLQQNDEKNIISMLKNRLHVVLEGDDWIQTKDGLTYYFGEEHGDTCSPPSLVDEDGVKIGTPCFGVIMSTKTEASKNASSYQAASEKLPSASNGVFPGYYKFYASTIDVVPQQNTRKILSEGNASEISKDALVSNDE